MSRRGVPCPHEQAVLEAVQTGHWPLPAESALQAHLATCVDCAAVAELVCALRVDLESAPGGEATTPTSSVMWWKLQQRARRDAARAAARPVAIAQALALACLCGLLVGLGGLAWHWLHPWGDWFAAQVVSLPSLTTTVAGRPLWRMTGLSLAALAVLVLAPVALYLAIAED